MVSTPKHLAWDDLPEEHKFECLAPSRRRLTDTVKLVAYRAETALATIVREKLSHVDEARALIRDLLRSDADIQPNEAAGVLEVRLHTLANPRSNRAIQHLLDHLIEPLAPYQVKGGPIQTIFSDSESDANCQYVTLLNQHEHAWQGTVRHKTRTISAATDSITGEQLVIAHEEAAVTVAPFGIRIVKIALTGINR
jgi:hypothetical protein